MHLNLLIVLFKIKGDEIRETLLCVQLALQILISILAQLINPIRVIIYIFNLFVNFSFTGIKKYILIHISVL
jgi:hypothetical protein